MPNAKELLATIKQGNQSAVDGFFRDCAGEMEKLANVCATALTQNKKLLFCGNGGSACDAMHIAGEFVGRFVHDRKALAAIALSADSGIITAVANDYSYDDIFSRQIEALGQEGDVLVALSTSGRSPSVIKALDVARAKGLSTALFTGEKGRAAPAKADFALIIPSLTTAHVQEATMVGLHGLATLIEAQLFS